MEESNQVKVLGCIKSEFVYDHESYSEKFYSFNVEVKRDSGKTDLITVIVSDRLIDVNKNYTNDYIYIRGQFRSFNQHDENKTRLLLYVFALEVELVSETKNINDVFLEGYICKPPVYRETPLGRQIADIILAVNRGYNKTDYIPCICWGRTAYSIGSMPVGACIRVAGRVQSREYVKDGETKVAYELSINLLERVK